MMQGVRTRASRPAIVALLAITLSLFSAVAAPPARAHGPEAVVDQQIDGAPECTEQEFPTTTVLDVLSSQRQTFTPALGSLTAIDLCLTVNVGEVLPGLPAFTMNVVELGDDGEQTVASKSFSFSGLPLLGSDTRYWHVDLDQVVPVEAGGRYAIELTAPRVVFQWRATCGSDLQACADGSLDRYAGGEASIGSPSDFGFRTWTPSAADVAVDIDAPALVCPDAATLEDTRVTVSNAGALDVGPFDVTLAMAVDGSEQALGAVTVPGLAAGSDPVVLSGADFAPVAPAAGVPARAELVAVADAGGVLVESDEGNNRATDSTTRVPCESGELDNLRLVAGDGSPLPDVPAGIVDLPLLDLSPQDIAAGAAGFAGTSSMPQDGAPTQTEPTDSDTLQSSPIRLSPIRLSPIRLSPIRLSPIHLSPIRLSPIRLSPIHLSPIRLSTFFGTVPPSVLDAVFLVGIPTAKPWEELIAAYPDQPDVTNRAAAQAAADRLLAMAPQDRSLGDVLRRLDPPLALRLDEVDLGAVMDLSLLGTALSTQRLSSVATPDGTSWCAFLTARSHLDCTGNGINPASETFVSLDLRGFPMEQLDLSGVPLADIGLRDDTVLAGMPLADSIARPADLPATTARIFRTAYTVLGARAVAEVIANPAELLVCDGTIQPDPCAGTLAEAEAAFAFRDNTTVGDLVRSLTTQAAADFDVTNGLLGVTGLLDLPWARFDTDPLDLDALSAGACPGVPYRISAEVVSDAPVVDPTLSVILPRGFDPKAGSATATIDGGAAFVLEDGVESDAGEGRTRVDLTVPGIVTSAVTATVQACASTTLGLFTADADAAWQTFDVAGSEPVIASRTIAAESSTSPRPERHADVRVVEREEPDGAATERVAAPETLILRHIPVGSDEDVFRIPLGEELPNGLTLQPGDQIRVWLAPPAGQKADGSVTDLDLTVYGPEQSPLTHSLVEPTPIRDGDTPIRPIEDDGAQVDGASGSAPAQSVQDSPIHLSPIRLSPIHLSPIRLSAPRAESNNRGDRVEYAELEIRPSDAGEVTIRVSSFLGDTDDRHYTLFYEVARPQQAQVLASCPSPSDFIAPAGSVPTIPAGTQTLILVNETLTAARYGAGATTAMMSSLQTLAAHDRVNGVVVPVDRDPEVAARVAHWRGPGWCDVVAANRVVAEIRSLVVDAVAQAPSIQHVVIVGGDDLNPMARVPDMTALGNETQYLGDVLAATQQNNPLVAAYAAGTTLTDDPYGTLRPIPWRDEALFVPELGIGRLVETPADVMVAVDQFLLTDGLLDAGTALVAGYDFNADGAAAAGDGLAELGAAVDDEFVDGGWSTSAIQGRMDNLDPDLATINAHSNHYALLSAVGDATGAAGEVLTTRSVTSAGTPLGTVAFTIGCHFGTSVPDAYASTGPDVIDVAGETLDWAQLVAARSGVLVANTGFGYGTDESVAYSERLMASFAGQAARTDTIGDAMAAAKQGYIAGIATPGSLDAKTVQQAILYGLPMYRFHDTPPVSDDVPTPQTQVDPITGLTVVSVDTGALHVGAEGSCVNCLQQIDTPDGTYFDVVGPALSGDPLVVHGRAVVPQLTQRFRLADVEVGGFVPSTISSIDVAGSGGSGENFDPVVARAVLSDGELERASETLDQAGPGTVAHARTFGDDVVMTVPMGAFRGASIGTDGAVRGQYRLDTRIAGQLYLRDTSGAQVDRLAPEISDLRVGRRPGANNDLLTVRLDAMDDAGIARGVVAMRIGGAWRFVELVVPSGAPTSAALMGAVQVASGAAVDTVQYWVVDRSGNVGFGTNKSLRPDVRIDTATATPWGTDPVVAIEGEQRNGWYVGDVTVRIVQGTSTTYHVFKDGQLHSSLGVGDAIVLSETGTVIVRVVADDDPSKITELTIFIDASDPVGIFHTPNGAADDATRTFVSGAVVPIDLRCRDAISGVASCQVDDADGKLNTSQVGTFTLTATVRDNAGNASVVSVVYHVVSRYRFDGFLTPVVDGRVNAEAGSTVPFKFRVYDGNTEITDTKIVKSATWQHVTCDGEPLGSPFAAESQPRLRYTTTHFTFNAVTDETWAVGDCYRFAIALADGSTLTAIATVT